MRIWLAVLTLFLVSADHAAAQGVPGSPHDWGKRPSIFLAEHPIGGGEAAGVLLGATFVGLAVADIVTAPASARWHNESFRANPSRSARTALALSLAATLVPVTAGAALVRADQQTRIGGPLIYGGMLLGPSVGHFYARRVGRGLTTIGLRAGTSVLAVVLSRCCV